MKNPTNYFDTHFRMYNGLQKILNDYHGKRIAIVSHGTSISFLLLKWYNLENVNISKKRNIKFNGKTVINDRFGSPELFKIIFNDHNIPIEIKRIKITF